MKTIISIARVLSALFRPVYYPIVGFIILFTFTYMSIFPWVFKLWVVVMVYVFTVLLPSVTTHAYRRLRGWRAHELGHREKRVVPTPYTSAATSAACSSCATSICRASCWLSWP